MKGIIKMFPAALAVFALASCSNDDFFGSSTESGKLQLKATVEAPGTSDDVTRAAFVPNTMKSVWQFGDNFRVYDAAVQKYDDFICNGTAIELDGDAAVDTYAKAIFPGDNVYYAGYDKANDDVIAIMEVPSSITYGGQEMQSDGTVAYVSDLPMWGDVTNATATNLEVDLKQLGAYTDITVYQKSVRYIRVLAAKAGVTDAAVVTGATTLTGATNAEILENAATILDATTPLAGYFEAQLKTNGVLKANTTNPVIKDSYSSLISVDLGTSFPDEVHVYIPIIADVEYKNLTIQTSTDGTNWTTLKRYAANAKFDRNGVLRKDLVRGEAPITAVVSSLSDLNTKLGVIATSYAGKPVNITASADIKTSEECAVITIPTLTADQVINLNFPITDNNFPLTIQGGTSGKKFTLNLNRGISGTEAVTINTAGELILGGSITSSGEGVHKNLNVVSAQKLSLGSDANMVPFTTDMNVVLTTVTNGLTVEACDGTIAAIDGAVAGNTTAITVNSGTVTAIGGVTAAATPVTVNDGIVGSINTTTGTIDIKGDALVSDVTTGAASSVSTETSLNSLTTASTGVTIKSTADDETVVETLTFKNAGAATLTLTGYYAAGTPNVNTLAKINNLVVDAAATAAVAVTSSGKAAIVNVSDQATPKLNFTTNASKLTDASANQKTTDINAAGEIYTAAQLAGVTIGKNYKLMANIDADSKVWTPVNLNGNFDGNSKTISNITVSGTNGGLFGTISGGEVKNLTIATVVSQKAQTGTIGALAAAATGTVAVKGVTITGAVIGAAVNHAKNINYGGLFGTTNGTITLTDNKVTATINGYANMGGYIGNVLGGSVNILTSATTGANTYQSTIAFSLNSTAPSAANAGTIGNFIGTISGDGTAITIGGTAEGKGGNIATFFDIDGTASPKKGVDGNNYNNPLKYETRTSGSMKFKGMYKAVKTQALSYEIGYCSATTLGTIFLYNTIKDDLGNEYQITLDNINVFE